MPCFERYACTPARCTLHAELDARYALPLHALRPTSSLFQNKNFKKNGRVYLAVRLHAKALVRWRGRVSVLLHALRYVQTDMSAYTKSETAKASVRKEANKATRASTQVRNEANKPKQAGNQILDSSEHSWRRCMVAGLAGLLGALSRSFTWCSLLLYLSLTTDSLLLSQNIYYTNRLPSQARQGVI